MKAITKRRWHRWLAIPLVLVLGGMLPLVSLSTPGLAADPIVNISAAGGTPGNAHDSAGTNGGEKLLQFTSAGHVLGFAGDGVTVASARHMLKIDFLNSRAVAPEADGDVSGVNSDGAARALGRVTYRNVWDGVTVVYETSGASIVKSTYYVDATKEEVQVDRIRLGYNRPVQIDEKGNLLIIYEDGTIVESAPVAWQETEGGSKTVTLTATDTFSPANSDNETKAALLTIYCAGDANRTGGSLSTAVVNAADITYFERQILGLESVASTVANDPGDANGDGALNAQDITKIELIILSAP